MVKDIRKKRKKGIPHLPKRGHNIQSTGMSDYKQAFLELKILFYLKEHNVVAPSHLATEVLRIRLVQAKQICKNLIGKKLIKENFPTPKSSVYAKTEAGNEACKNLLKWFAQNQWLDLEWIKLVLRIQNETYKDIEF